MTNFFNKLKKPCSWPIFGLFSQFWGQKKKKIQKIPLSCKTSYGFAVPCQNLEKIDHVIPRKRPDGRTEGRKDGRSERQNDRRTDGKALFHGFQ